MIDHIPKYIELAKKYNLSVDEVQKICSSSFEFVKKSITEMEEPIHFSHLGKFKLTNYGKSTKQRTRV